MLALIVACGAGFPGLGSDGPVTARVIIADVKVSDQEDRVLSITVRTDAGEEMSLRLSDDINPADWDPMHLKAHQGLGESLGLKIGVTYVRTPEGLLATEIIE